MYISVMVLLNPCRNGSNEPQVFSREGFSSLHACPPCGGSRERHVTPAALPLLGGTLHQGRDSQGICWEMSTYHSVCCVCVIGLFCGV